jgi:cytochrome b6-f complex iron-sulfur subunit
METHMNDRRRFLQVVGSGAVAMGVGCTAAVNNQGPTGTGAGGAGAGGSDTGGLDGAGGGGTGTGCTTNPPGLKIGKPTDYAAAGLHIVTSKGILIGRDGGGLYALSAVCTHQLCDMSAVDAQGPFGEICVKTSPDCSASQAGDILCLCHGSVFSTTGAVVQGPAHTALKAYALALGCDGFLYVNKAKVVAASVRLMP